MSGDNNALVYDSWMIDQRETQKYKRVTFQDDNIIEHVQYPKNDDLNTDTIEKTPNDRLQFNW